jgi:hypothetical protein
MEAFEYGLNFIAESSKRRMKATASLGTDEQLLH